MKGKWDCCLFLSMHCDFEKRMKTGNTISFCTYPQNKWLDKRNFNV